MLRLILGPAGSGKTLSVLRAIRARGEGGGKSVLIVPEQYSHDAERQLCAVCGDGLSLYGEVLSFTRLASRARCPASGRRLDKGGRLLLMERALSEVYTQLAVFASAGRTELPAELLRTYDRLRSSGVSAQAAAEAAEGLPGRLPDKLRDLSLIFETYRALLPADTYDPTDVLEQLARSVAETGVPDGAAVWLDGFTDFTAQELAVVRAMLARRTDVTVCLTCGGLHGTEDAFALPRLTAARLLREAAERGEKAEIVTMGEDARSRAPELSWACAHLFDPAAAPYGGACGAVELYTAASAAEECEIAAARVRALAREKGYRWRDFAVVARGWEEYRDLAENLFARFEIPVTRSGRTDIAETPVPAFLLSALDAAAGDWEETSVLRMLKTGLSGVDGDERDMLENYVHTWGIRGGRAWKRPGGWTMNPSGYRPRMSPAEQALLAAANRGRERTAALLGMLESGLRDADTASGKAAALYDFLAFAGVPEKLAEKTAALRAAGESQTAEEYAQIWEILVTALEQFSAVLGDLPLSNEEFARLFRLLLSQYDVGVIPASVDSVGLGDMSRMRRRGVRCLVVLGADDAHLPLVGPESGLLTDTDCADLAACGIELADTSETRLDREMNVIYSSLSLPSERLLVIRTGETGGRRPSFVPVRLREMFGLSERRPGAEILAEAPGPCFELAVMDAGRSTPASRQAAACLETLPQWRERLEAARRAACAERGRFSPETAAKLAGETLCLSATGVESFEACRFGHGMRYTLRLQPRRPAGFDAPETGSFIHYLMEHAVREAEAGGGFAALTPERCRALTRRYAGAYAEKYIGGLETKSERFAYLYRRLTDDAGKIVEDMAAELAVSSFRPMDFELSFSEGGELPPVRVEEGLSVNGKVDRVDGWVRGGKLYLRVVDYKTGKKDFSLSDIWYGMGMQMLMYLFALEAEGNRRYGGEIVPAGVLYAPARDVIVQAGRGADADEIRELRAKELIRKGLILADPDVIDAMEHGDAPRFLPVRFGKDGQPTPENLATLEQLGLLRRHIGKTLREMRSAVRAGDLQANPYYRSEMDNACLWCDYREACRFGEDAGDRRRMLTRLPTPEIWDKLKEEGTK